MEALRLGDRVVYDDNDCTVEGIGAGHIFLRSDSGDLYSLVPAAALAAQRATSVAPPAAKPVDLEAVLDGLPEGIVVRALDRYAHVMEALTGYQSGSSDDAQPGEPRAEYDPARVANLVERQKSKARELGCDERTFRRWCQAVRDHGITGLVDARSTGLVNPLRNADSRIIEAIEKVATKETNASTGNRARFRRRVKRYLLETHNIPASELPSDKTLDRYADYILTGSYTFQSATTRRSKAVLGPKVFTGFTSTRAGEVVLMDVNRLDIMAWDPETDTAIAVELIMAMDAYTRAVLAGRIVPLGTNRTDASMLLADILNPLEARDHWAESLRLSALQIPFERVVDLDERLTLAAARPIIRPETLVVDNGKIFISNDFRNACQQAGISLDLARVKQGTDKAQIERAFGTMRTQFAQHVTGYKGNTVVHRGEHVEDQALYTIAELEELFLEWMVVVHNRRVNRALRLPCAPDVQMSPNEAYRESIARCGYLPVLANQHLYFDLLPTEWVTIQQSYVDVRGLSYSGDVLVGRDHEPSPYAAKDGKWPVKYDPRDRLYVYFKDVDGQWTPLRWVHGWEGIEPFTDCMVDFARRLRTQQEARRATQAEVAEELERLQNFVDIDPSQVAKLRRRRSRDVERARHAEADRNRGGLETAPLRSVPLTVPNELADDDFDISELSDLPLLGES